MQTSRAAARALGAGSLAFAVAGFLAPSALARLLGYGERRWFVQTLAARDLAIGTGLLVAERPSPWLRARLASEAADALIHAAAALTGTFERKRAFGIALGAAASGALEYALWLRGRSGEA